MPDIDGSVITARVATPNTRTSGVSMTSEATPRRRSPFGVGLAAVDLGMWPRMAAVIVLSGVAYGVSYGQIVADAIAGSRAAYPVVVPVLAGLIAFSYRSAPRGVGDSESDSIAAALFGIIGLSAIHLISQRTPALAGLWRLQLLEVVVWFGCAVVVLFGVRRAVQMWELWLFAVLSATPLPFLLATAALGGSDLAVALLAAALGAVAVFLAGRFAPIVPRVGTALGSFAVAATVVALTPLGHVNLLLVIVATSGLIPVLAIAALSGVTAARRPIDQSDASKAYPRLSPISLGVLAATSLVLLAINPAGTASPALSTVSSDWMKQAGLSAPTSFPFITRFLGPDCTLDRYDVPGVAGMPAAAVDVMTTANGAALQDFVDAVWYPSSRPLDYSPAEPTGAMPLGSRVIYTNADTATDGAGGDWYAVTWMWHSGDVSQQVTVTVSQTIGGDQPPPAPTGLSLVETALRPAMWLARQQPHQTGRVDPRVSQRAAQVVGLLVRHGALAGEAPPGD
jgi:hypothetical protein